jgi:L-asparaginase/Glu-tRNA(Gln) amidotransferase subunit D
VDAGVVVSLDGSVEAADDVTKMHTSAFDTFKSPNAGSLGAVRDDGA